jgi:HlyD family secretion protein
MGIQMKLYDRFRLWTSLAVVIAVTGCILGHSLPVAAQSPGFNGAKSKEPIPVTAAAPEFGKIETITAEKGQVRKDLVLTGELKAAQSIVITAPDIRSSFQTMVTYLAPEGSQIKKGELIVEFDDSSLLSQQSEAERTLDETKLNIEKTKMDLEAQRCDLLNSISQAESQLKQDELYGKISKELLSANTYQKYQLNLEKSRLSLEKAKEQYKNFEEGYASEISLVEITRSQAAINLKQIESDMALLKVYAPQDGILIYGDNWTSNRKIQPGDTLFHGMEVASLPDLSSMQVLGYVYDTEYGSLARDMHCQINFDALPDFRTGGKIVSLTNVASRKGFTSEKKLFQVTVQLEKVDPQIMKPGMTARIDIPVILAKETLAIPREYLGVDSKGGYFVITGADPKKTGEQPVTVGAVGDLLVEVVSGISAGDPLYPVY